MTVDRDPVLKKHWSRITRARQATEDTKAQVRDPNPFFVVEGGGTGIQALYFICSGGVLEASARDIF